MNRFIKISLLIGILAMLMLLSACNIDSIKQYGMGILLGEPIKSNDKTEEQTQKVIENRNNFYIRNDEFSEADFKYTVNRAYKINSLSEANLSLDDFPNSDAKNEYFTPDGKLKDDGKQLLCVDLSIDKLSERRTSLTGASDVNVHILEHMPIYIDKFENIISSTYVCIKLNQTEDITRSANETEYNYFSLKNGQTAQFLLCYIVDKAALDGTAAYLNLGRIVTINNGKAEFEYANIPLNIEGVS